MAVGRLLSARGELLRVMAVSVQARCLNRCPLTVDAVRESRSIIKIE
jgi:hypothetical protein